MSRNRSSSTNDKNILSELAHRTSSSSNSSSSNESGELGNRYILFNVRDHNYAHIHDGLSDVLDRYWAKKMAGGEFRIIPNAFNCCDGSRVFAGIPHSVECSFRQKIEQERGSADENVAAGVLTELEQHNAIDEKEEKDKDDEVEEESEEEEEESEEEEEEESEEEEEEIPKLEEDVIDACACTCACTCGSGCGCGCSSSGGGGAQQNHDDHGEGDIDTYTTQSADCEFVVIHPVQRTYLMVTDNLNDDIDQLWCNDLDHNMSIVPHVCNEDYDIGSASDDDVRDSSLEVMEQDLMEINDHHPADHHPADQQATKVEEEVEEEGVVTNITDVADIKDSDYSVVDFWAPWCQPCLRFSPAFEETARSGLYKNLRFMKSNLDESLTLANLHGVQAIPVVLLLHEGRVLDQVIGPNSENWNAKASYWNNLATIGMNGVVEI